MTHQDAGADQQRLIQCFGRVAGIGIEIHMNFSVIFFCFLLQKLHRCISRSPRPIVLKVAVETGYEQSIMAEQDAPNTAILL